MDLKHFAEIWNSQDDKRSTNAVYEFRSRWNWVVHVNIGGLVTGALLGARLRLCPGAAVVALVRAGLALLREDSGLLANLVGGGNQHQRLLPTLCPPLLVLVLRLLLVSGRRGLHWTGAEHGEICQASILVHQSADMGGRMRHTHASRPKHTHILVWGNTGSTNETTDRNDNSDVRDASPCTSGPASRDSRPSSQPPLSYLDPF